MDLPPAHAPVMLHTSWRGLLSAFLSPVLLLGYATLLLTARGPGSIAVAALVLGLGLGAVALLDYPHRTELGRDGVRRVCVLRTQLLRWSELVAIERAPGSARSALRRRGEDGQPKVVSGGLVARGLGRRRYLLTDRLESQQEYDEVRRLLDRLDVATNLRAGRPTTDAPPTDLYRRSGRARKDRT